MIRDTPGIIAFLLLIEGGIFLLSALRPLRRLFTFLPPMFWIYFLPMMANTAGVIPRKSEVYSAISTHFLPACLILLLVSVDLKAILRLGKTALLMMLAGSAGIILGGPIALLLFQHWLPEGIWKGFGALSGSWIGGSANMIAVKEAIRTPDDVFLPMVVVDTIVCYSWMGLLIALSAFQGRFDRWNRSNTAVMEELNRKLSTAKEAQARPMSLNHFAGMLALAAAGAWLAGWMGQGLFDLLGTWIPQWLPSVLPGSARLAGRLSRISNVMAPYTWTIILASTMGILLSFTPARRLESAGASKVGYAILYFVLAAIGARANLAALWSAPLLIAAGVVWLLIHAACLLLAARLLRAPMFLAVTASQANVGGPASAPVVAAIYQPSLAPVGLLMAVLGNILGTYLGLLCSELCRLVSMI